MARYAKSRERVEFEERWIIDNWDEALLYINTSDFEQDWKDQFVLRYYEGLEYKPISRRYHKSISALHHRMRRMRAAVLDHLASKLAAA